MWKSIAERPAFGGDRVVRVVRAIAALCASAAVLGPARADLGRLDPMAKPNTPIRTGFTLALCVSLHAVDEKELTGEFPVDERGNLQLRVGGEPIPPIPVAGCTAAEAQRLVLRAVERFFAAPPDVKVGIARMPRITVIVQGATFRNGAIRLPLGARLSDALAETSYLPNADLSAVQIARRDRDARVTLTVDFRGAGAEELSDPVLQDGDRIAIPALPIAPSAKNVAVLGEVARAGMVPWRSGMAVRDALDDAGGLLASADAERVVVRRVGRDAVLTVDANRAMAGVLTDNVPLQPDDTVFVMPRDTGRRCSVVGAVASPGTFDLRKPTTLTEAIVQAGGFRPDADRGAIVLIRGMLTDPAQAKPVTLNYDEIASGRRTDVALEPGDMVQVPERKRPRSPLLDIGALLLRLFLF